MLKKFLIIFVLLLVTFISLALTNKSNKIRPTTLKESIDIAYSTARKWNPNAKIYYVSSVDDEEKDSYDNSLGKRRVWNFQFQVPNTKLNYLINIKDGQVVNSKQVESLVFNEYLVSVEEVNIDSPYVLKKAIEKFNIKPGKVWADGYHFSIGKGNGKIFITVTGINDDGYMTKVNVDIVSGEIINASSKSPTSGSLFLNNTNLFHSDIPISISGLDAFVENTSNNSLLSWGMEYPLTFMSTSFIKLSEDDGVTWKKVNFKDDILKVYFSSEFSKDNSILIFTNDSELRSNDKGNTWNKVYTFESQILDISMKKNNIAVLTKDNIYVSFDNGITWSSSSNKENANQLRIDFNTVQMINNGTNIFLYNDGMWKALKNPLNGVTNIDLNNGMILLSNSNSITISYDYGITWEMIDCDKKIAVALLNSNYEHNTNLYIQFKDGELCKYSLKKGADNKISISSKQTIMNIAQDITGLTEIKDDKMYYSTSAKTEWRNLE